MTLEFSITDITESNRREKLLAAVYALSERMGIEASWLEKAKTHKYISRKWASDHWEYEYPQTNNERRINMANQTELITGVQPLSVNPSNVVDKVNEYIAIIQQAINRGVRCKWLQNRKIAGIAKDHFFMVHGKARPQTTILERAALLPFVLPIIEKYGHISHAEQRVDGGYYYELTGKAEINGKKHAISLVLTDAGKDLLYISVIGQQKNTIKSLAGAGDLRHRGPIATVGKETLSNDHTLIIPQISAKSIDYPTLEISIQNITMKNQKAKFAKAMRAVSRHLGVPVSIEGRENHNHGPEPFFYRAQEELNYRWYNFFSTALKETYDFVTAYFGLPRITTLLKADVLTHKGKVLYSPETGEPIKKADWDRFVILLEKFLNRRLKDTDKKIILEGKALGRILNRMLKYNTLEAVKDLSLDDVKYRGKTLDWISDSVKNMQSALGGELSRGEAARIQVLRQSAAERITKASAAVKADVKQILIDGVKGRKSKGEISQTIFDRMTGANRDFQKIADTEIQNAANNAFLLDEVHNAEPGERVYFQRIERIDANTCNFCKKMHNVVVLWSDHPLPSDRIDDPIADYAIWDGKDWDGRKEFVATGVFHPYCRGVWVRYNGAMVNALSAELQGKTKEFNAALAKAKNEYREKGVENPTDKTAGFLDTLYQVYASYGPEPGNKEREIYSLAFKQARMEFSRRGIPHPTGKTTGFRDRIQDIYRDLLSRDIGKSLTWSGYKLQDRYRFAGLDISIENKKGSTRSGVDNDGHKWHTKMHFDYGYIRGSVGVDKDHVDVYIGPNEEAQSVYIVHQNDPATGKYDEDKIMLGFDSLKAAREAYLKQYDRPGFLGSIDTLPLEEFREKVLSKKNHGKMVKSYTDRVHEALGGIL